MKKEAEMRLQGKTALIPGAISGIGQAIAEAFAREGARVGVVGRNAQQGSEDVLYEINGDEFTTCRGKHPPRERPGLETSLRFPTFALISHPSAQNRVLLTFGGKPQHISEDTLVMMLVNSVNVRRFLR